MSGKTALKQKQRKLNKIALNLWDTFEIEWEKTNTTWKRLYHCNAEVGYDGRYYVLRSYGTIIAFYDTKNNALVDVLRYVYGYTATSAQHIAKFRKYIRFECLYLMPDIVQYREC